MIIIIGLGNPGKQYLYTRHNAGFLFLDFLACEWNATSWEYETKSKAEVSMCELKGQKIFLVKPQTYMNESGWTVEQFLKWHNADASSILVVHDDLDIQFGSYKFSEEKSPKLHYGIISIENILKTKQFKRLRIGIDNREGDRHVPGNAYVLSAFTSDEIQKLDDVFTQAYSKLSIADTLTISNAA